MKKIIILLAIVLMSSQISCYSSGNANSLDIKPLKEEQAALQASLPEKYPFLKLSSNNISGDLAPFFEKMKRLSQNQNKLVNIVHIGDSHIQADMMTEEIRIRLQKLFGNAGRGLIFPHRIAHSNEPNNIYSSASGTWQQVSVISKNRESEPGLGTRSVFTNDSTASFNILVKDNSELPYQFKKMTILSAKGEEYFDFNVSNDWGEIFSSMQSEENIFCFNKACNSFSLKVMPSAQTQKEFRLNGIVLENDTSGILYHSMGTNGAHFAEYNVSPEFFKQLSVLQPDLIIISLGTNEGAARYITKEKVYADAQEMIENIRSRHPDTPILLTTPTHNFYKKKYPNQRMALVHEALLKVAADNNCAVIDLYKVGGGYGSCRQWKAKGLLRADGIHFTEEGYRLQGDLIYNAIINSYIKYVSSN